MTTSRTPGHLAAVGTVLIWGTTFISTKILLEDFQPVEILFFRFLLGLAALFLVCPKRLKGTTWREEVTFALAGLCGICLYYLLENIALTYSLACNVGVIVSSAPFFTALVAHFVTKGEEKLGRSFLLGFLIAMAGISLISFNGAQLSLSPKGDLLALLAAVVWAFYSVLIRRIGGFGYPTILTTRRTFFYGLVCMVPALFLFGFRPELSRVLEPLNLGNLLYLGLGASALCFVTWNFAVRLLGAIRASVYIYLGPVITVATSAVILGEPVTPLLAAGTALTLVGLGVSEFKK